MSNEKYKRLIESIELNKIELQSLECKQNRNFPSEKRKNMDLGLKSNIVETNYEGIELEVQMEFEVIAFKNDTDDDEIIDVPEEDRLFQINFVLYLKYELDVEEVEDILTEYEEEIDTFIERNVPINAWPYARETISSTTTRMGLPPLIIPTYKNLDPV